MLSLGALAVLFHGGGPDGFAVGRDAQPDRRVHARGRNRGRQRRARALLRVLVVGRLRVDGDVRRGVADPEADHPARHHDQRRSASASSTCSSRGWRSRAPVRSSPSSSRRTPATAGDIFFDPVRSTYGDWAITMFKLLLVTGSFACGMAFHNCASRYLYALGREGLSKGLQKTLGATHPQARLARTSRRSCRPASRWCSSWRSSSQAWIRTCTCTHCWRFSAPWRS